LGLNIYTSKSIMKILNINHISLHVKNLEKSIEFYRRLGLKQLPRPDFDFEGAWLTLGPQQLHLIVGREKEIFNDSRGVHYALTVDSIEVAEEWLINQNIKFRPPKTRAGGVIQIFLKDPDGYLLELTEG